MWRYYNMDMALEVTVDGRLGGKIQMREITKRYVILCGNHTHTIYSCNTLVNGLRIHSLLSSSGDCTIGRVDTLIGSSVGAPYLIAYTYPNAKILWRSI